MKRHCIAHVHGVDHPAVGMLLDKIGNHQNLFDGGRVASVMMTDPVATKDVVRRLETFGFHIFLLPNDGVSREMHGFFEQSLPWIAAQEQDGLVFFCHSKGTSHDPNGSRFRCIRRWNEVMWRHNVADFRKHIWPRREQYGAFGTLRKVLEKVRSPRPQPYHYSGTFYWLRLDLLHARNWQRDYAAVKAAVLANTLPDVRDDLLRYFAEGYPATIFPKIEESYSVVDVEGGLYTEFFWDDFDRLYGRI